MKKSFAALIFAAALAAASASFAQGSLVGEVAKVGAPLTAANAQAIGTPVGVPVAIVQPAATIDAGTFAGQALIWVVTVFGGTIGTVLTGFLYRMLQKAGVQASEAMRDKLQGIIVNGLNFGAAQAAKELQGRAQVEIKDAAVAKAVEYAKAHGAETLRALGLDPTSPEAVEAIKARIETAIVDSSTPTAQVLDPDGPPKPAPIPVADAKVADAITKS